jgi:predicted nucleotidyltransferase
MNERDASMTKEIINQAVSAFTKEIEKTYGSSLARVFLFGSCARGDYDAESDIDVMVLLKLSEDDVQRERGTIADIADQIDSDFDYDILLAPVAQSKDVFMKYQNVLPFYKNVQKEGVVYA